MPDCPCTSLTIWLESIKVERVTTSGTGFFEMLFGGFFEQDQVSFGAITTGNELVYPANGRLAWPERGTTYSLAAGDPAVPNEPVEICTVQPYGSGCELNLDCFVVFFEHDWGDLHNLLNRAIRQAAQAGLIQLPAPYTPFIDPLLDDAINVAEDIFGFLTGFGGERMGHVPIHLPVHRLDDPRNLDQFPWRGLTPSRMFDKQRDSFRYRTFPENYGGRWEAVLYIERTCARTEEEQEGGSNKPGSEAGEDG